MKTTLDPDRTWVRSSGGLLTTLFAIACTGADAESGDSATPSRAAAAEARACDPDDVSIALPDGFCATVFADEVEGARHMAVRDDGVVFVARRNQRGGERGGVAALRDTTGDGRADEHAVFGENGGTGMDLVDDTLLYFGTDDAVLRYHVPRGSLSPAGAPDTVVADLPTGSSHSAKSMVVHDGVLYVNHGSPSNSCQEQDRQPRSPGQNPCPELERRAGIWRFDASASDQTFEDGERFATGMRNMVAIDVRPGDGQLFGVQHGRDQLAANWDFDEEYSARNPGEEMFRIDEGDDFGWPYCYWSTELHRRVLAPEYGGDGTAVGRCASTEDPIAVFPGHWAPNDLLFYTGDAFPERYRGGAFIAFHGSWNRSPLPQAGYNVAFVPFGGGGVAGDYEVFAEGFAGEETVRASSDAEYRPTGLALGPDGALYVSDDAAGRIWRIVAR